MGIVDGAARASSRSSRTWSSCRSSGSASAAASAGRSPSAMPEISAAMVEDKAADVAATGAQILLSGDGGCLLNIGGRAGGAGEAGPADARRRSSCGSGRVSADGPAPRLPRGGAPALAATRSCGRTSGARWTASWPSAPPRSPTPPSGATCARSGASIRARTLAKLPELLEQLEASCAANGIRVHWAETTEDANAIVLEILRGARRDARRQGQVDGLRGDAPERLPRGARRRVARVGPRRVHHPAGRRDARRTSSCRRSTRTGSRSRACSARRSASAKYTEDVDALTAIARRVLRQEVLRGRRGHLGRELRRRRDGDARASSRTRATAGCRRTSRRSTSP